MRAYLDGTSVLLAMCSHDAYTKAKSPVLACERTYFILKYDKFHCDTFQSATTNFTETSSQHIPIPHDKFQLGPSWTANPEFLISFEFGTL